MIESYTLFACYLVLAVICWFFFYHHPSHIGIQIRRKQDNSNNYAFNVDNTPVGWNRPNRAGSDEDNNQVDQQNLQNGITEIANGNKLDVTLIDALRIKELNLLIVSYLFRQAHNQFIRQNPLYTANITLKSEYYYMGAIIGVMLTGIAADRWL